jgi:hypothetical protein
MELRTSEAGREGIRLMPINVNLMLATAPYVAPASSAP